jgi:hypothetical protein
MEASWADNTEDNGETRLSETGHCTVRTVDATVSPDLQGRTDGAARRALATQQQLEGTTSLAMERWCPLVALAGGTVGEEHGGSRGGCRAKCDEEKEMVMFALTIEAV